MVSGESGAGKTESTRRVLEYLVKTSSRLASSYGGAAAAAGHLQNKLLQSNPLLETLGNAKTMRNDNSCAPRRRRRARTDAAARDRAEKKRKRELAVAPRPSPGRAGLGWPRHPRGPRAPSRSHASHAVRSLAFCSQVALR